MIELITFYSSLGILLGIVITSGPYTWILEKFKQEDNSFLTCGLCMGIHVSWITQVIRMDFNMLSLVLVPIAAELCIRWILSI